MAPSPEWDYPRREDGHRDSAIHPEVNNRAFENLLQGNFEPKGLKWIVQDPEAGAGSNTGIYNLIFLLRRVAARKDTIFILEAIF